MGAGGHTWGCEGVQSFIMAYGHQYLVQGDFYFVCKVLLGSELAEFKDIRKCQQDQLTQLTQSIASLQEGQRRIKLARDGPVICRRCQCPGHFARECDGEQVPFRSHSASVAPSSDGAKWPTNSIQGPELMPNENFRATVQMGQ